MAEWTVQRGVNTSIGLIETAVTTTIVAADAAFVAANAVVTGVAGAVPLFGAIKAVFEGIVKIVAAVHASTVNPFNGFVLADLPFKNEDDLRGTMLIREYLAKKGTTQDAAPKKILNGKQKSDFTAFLSKYWLFILVGIIAIGVLAYWLVLKAGYKVIFKAWQP